MTDVVGRGLVRETVSAGEGVVNVAGLVREAIVLQSSANTQITLSALAREAVVVQGTGVVPSGARQYAVSIIG